MKQQVFDQRRLNMLLGSLVDVATMEAPDVLWTPEAQLASTINLQRRKTDTMTPVDWKANQKPIAGICGSLL